MAATVVFFPRITMPANFFYSPSSPCPGRMPVRPGSLHEDAPRVDVAALGDRSAPLLAAAGILSRDQTDKIHQLPSRGKAVKVDQLGKDRHRRERVHSPQGLETGDGRDDVGIYRLLPDLCVEPSDPLDLLVA